MGQKQDRKYQNQEMSTFLKNLILILTEEKRILLHQKRAQNSEISTFVLITIFQGYCKELNFVETTKECL